MTNNKDREKIINKLLISISILEKVYWKYVEEIIQKTKSIEIDTNQKITINF